MLTIAADSMASTLLRPASRAAQCACKSLWRPITASRGARSYSYSYSSISKDASQRLSPIQSLKQRFNKPRYHSTAAGFMPNEGSVSTDEMTHFTSLASSWWDPLGPSRILHLMNPIRHEWIADCLSEGRSAPKVSADGSGKADAGLEYLDIGCGGGIFAESLARTIPQDIARDGLSPVTQAKSITAIDPTPMMIKIATSHAQHDPAVSNHLKTGKFKYLNTSLEDLPSTLSTPSPKFDVITLFEVLEHVSPHNSSQPRFLKQILSMLRPGGWLVGSTIARAFPAWVLHDVIAEAPWPVGVVPKGTHDWYKFVSPHEVEEWSKKGLQDIEKERVATGDAEAAASPITMAKFKSTGAVYIPGFGWKLVKCLDKYGNYFFAVQRT